MKTKQQAESQKWEIHFKLHKEEAAKHGLREHSDYLGWEFETREEAEAFVVKVKQDPERVGCCEWLKDATFWVEPLFEEGDER